VSVKLDFVTFRGSHPSVVRCFSSPVWTRLKLTARIWPIAAPLGRN